MHSPPALHVRIAMVCTRDYEAFLRANKVRASDKVTGRGRIKTCGKRDISRG